MKLPLLLTVVSWFAWMATPASAQHPDSLRYALPAPASGLQSGGQLGWSVAADGGYTVVGAPFDDLGGQDSGVVKVFDTTTGTLLHLLVNPTPAAGDNFGHSVAISGNRVVVGAYADDTGAFNAGSAYVYDLSSATPTVPVATLSKASPVANDNFGYSVAVSGNRVAISARGDDAVASNGGRVFIYDLASATPTVPIADVNHPTPGANDEFGNSVAVSGNRLVVGATRDDQDSFADAGSAFVYDLASPTPNATAQALLKPNQATSDNFGVAVAVSGQFVVVGAYGDDAGATDAGSAYVYDLTSGSPVLTQTLNNPFPAATDLFGNSVAISGTRVVVGTYGDDTVGTNAGSAYVYDLTSGTPTVPVHTLDNNFPAPGDLFGNSVAISGTRVVIGAYLDDAGAADAGSAYVYDVAGATPTVPVLSLNNPGPSAFDSFGRAVAVSGTRVVIGAVSESDGSARAGTASIYDLAGATPAVPVHTLNHPSPSAGDYFGYSVGIAGNRVVIGAYGDDTGATDAGCAFVYDLTGATPTVPTHTLNNPTPVTGDRFGNAVAISGDRVVVGAVLDDTGAINTGSAYIYDLTSGTPTVPIHTLNNPAPAPLDFFGNAVAISGTRVLVGAYLDDAGAIDGGTVYLYDLSTATPTVPVGTISNPAPAIDDEFGISVAISGGYAVIGAWFDDTGAVNAGSAYVYDLTGGAPILVHTLNNPSPAIGDQFGGSVAIAGTRVLIGASFDDTGATDAGSAYVYDLSSGTPTVPVVVLNNPGSAPLAFDGFGAAVALDGTTAAIGAPSDDSPQTDKGSAYIFGPADSVGPTGGTMTLTPVSPVDGGAALGVTFAGWTDPSLPLSYQVLVDNVPVAPAGPGGTVNFTGPTAPGIHSLKGRIADSVGNVTEVTQSFTVLTAQESWRRIYFGNPDNVGPGADTEDPDSDGHNNLFEYQAGLVPTDASSFLALRVETVAGQPGHKAIIFSPRLAGRTYTVKCKTDLANPMWLPPTNFTTSDNGSERTVIDLDAGTGPKYYIVEITMP